MAVHGNVPFENLVGRVETIFWSVDRDARGGAAPVRFERIGTRVR
jgi:hypothetical protein